MLANVKKISFDVLLRKLTININKSILINSKSHLGYYGKKKNKLKFKIYFIQKYLLEFIIKRYVLKVL